MSGSPFREVHFCVSSDPVADFASKTAPLRLLLDVPTAALGKLKSAGVELRTLPTRRVWFLAVNHRVPMLADEDLRRALAHGLNREQLLADSFGGGRPSFRTAAIAALGSTLPVMAAARRRGPPPSIILSTALFQPARGRAVPLCQSTSSIATRPWRI